MVHQSYKKYPGPGCFLVRGKEKKLKLFFSKMFKYLNEKNSNFFSKEKDAECGMGGIG